MSCPDLRLRIGVLIIGSLYWDDRRETWRRARLQMREVYDVRACIRYGRLSTGRDSTYTMVFSQEAAAGQAKVVRYQRDVATPADLNLEAEELWGAESNGPPDGSTASDWGCVALVCNGSRAIPEEISSAWTSRVRRQPCYGCMPHTASERSAVSRQGFLEIEWPVVAATGAPVPLDLLIATANKPTLSGEPLSYPTPQAIAAAWRRPTALRNDRVAYFQRNVAHGICTFEDARISESLSQ